VRAMLSSLAMVLAMVKAPGDVVGDDPSLRSPAPQDPGQALAASAADRRAARRAFPVGGAHTYGDGFGDRPGHQGQDLLAGCGTPLRAAAPATVRLVDEDGAAGRHVVMRTRGGRDLVYMHLSDVGVHEGEEVDTGERLGTVGQTGNASTCHLHFEVWDAPGWYAGGEPRDPGSMLRSRERAPVVAAP
jgi:murein DD-endopeptidase MepM/ murein hydrolase activator NlpD